MHLIRQRTATRDTLGWADVSDFRLFAFHDTPDTVKALFASAARADAGWDWFAVLADTTLVPGEEAVIATTGSAAIALVRRGGMLRGLTAPYTCRFQPVARNATDAVALGRALARTLRVSLRLDALDATDPATAGLLEGLAGRGLLVERYRHFVNWWDAPREHVSWWQARGTRLKETVRRRRARLERDHQLELTCHRDAADLRSALPIYQALYACSWKQPEPHPAFIPALIDRLGTAGRVRLGILSIDGSPAAAQIWLVEAGRATIFKLAQDQAFDAYSPGTVLTAWLFETLIAEDRLSEIDFGRGDDAYKRDWLGQRRERLGVIACRTISPRGLGLWARAVLPGRVKAALRHGTG